MCPEVFWEDFPFLGFVVFGVLSPAHSLATLEVGFSLYLSVENGKPVMDVELSDDGTR